MLISLFNVILIILVTFFAYRYFELYERSSPDSTRDSFLLQGVASIIDKVEGYEEGHAEGIARLALLIGRDLGLSEERCSVLCSAAMMHDVGETLLPKEIFRSETTLSEPQAELVRTHTLLGELHLKSKFVGSDEVPSIVRWHHERWDGLGYPDNLKGDEIPLEARIIHLADAVSAMSAPRCYRKSLKNKREIASELLSQAGLQFDPQLVKIWLKIEACEIEELEKK